MVQLNKVVVTPSPHIKVTDGTTSIMLDVILALIPALVIGTMTFGPRAIALTGVSVVSCVVFELIYNKINKQDLTINDLSAVVTGMLLAYNVPVSLPMWTIIIGAGFSIIVVKMIFGGLGQNFINPALGGRMFLYSWTSLMVAWTLPGATLPIFNTPTEQLLDSISTATPMAQLKENIMPSASITDMFLGQIGGSLGETSAFAILAGGCYLLYKKVITPTIPLSYISSVFIIAYLFPIAGANPLEYALAHVLGGGLMLGAIFMATDYTTSPVTVKGQIIFGIGCGLITMFIRKFGGLVEGVSYAIVLMNTLVFLIDKYTMPKRFGASKKIKEAE